MIELPTRRATLRLARAIAQSIAPGDLVVLDGPLGAGKTFLARGVLRALGVPEEIAVPSPTFALMNEYGPNVGARVPIVHADVYRLLGDAGGATEDSIDSVADLGLRERRGEGWALIAEWARELVPALGGDAVVVRMQSAPRRADVSGVGPRGEHLQGQIAIALGERFP